MGHKALRLTNKLQYHLDSVCDVEFLDGNLFISTSMDYTTCLWDIGKLTSSQRATPKNGGFKPRKLKNGLGGSQVTEEGAK